MKGKEHGEVQEGGQRAGSSKSSLGSAPQSTHCMLIQGRRELQALLPANLAASRRFKKGAPE